MLNYLNNKFINSSFRIKVELYLLPFMFIYLIYYLSTNFTNDEKSIEIKNNFNISEYENKKFNGSFLELFSSIEKNAKLLNMQVISINNKKNIVELKLNGKKVDFPNLIRNIENINDFTKIDSIIIDNKKDLDFYSFNLKINLNKFYIKKLKKEKNLKNLKLLIPSVKAENTYKIKGIIDNYVLINNTWIKEGESIDNLKLIEINRNFVVLENNSKKVKLELQNEEYLKNIY
jgi:hypothetical protein